MVAAQQVPVQLGDVRYTSVATDEVAEAVQISPVAVHGAERGVAIQLQPGQVLVNGLGQRQGCHGRTLAANFQKLKFNVVIEDAPVGSVGRKVTVVGIAGSADCGCSMPTTFFKRTLAATVASYGAAFVLLVGSPGFGLLFPTDYDGRAAIAPAPPALALISPVVSLFVIASGQPVPGYGIRPTLDSQVQLSKGGGSGACVPLPNGGVSCSSNAGFSGYSPGTGTASPGTTLHTGFLAGLQYWQASIVMQLMICAVALALSALLLPPIRRFGWRRNRVPAAGPA